MRQSVIGNVVVSLAMVLLVLIFGSGVALSQDLDLNDQTASMVGQTVTLILSIANAPNSVEAFGFDISFNASVLEFDSFTRGGLVTNWDQLDVSTPMGTTGRIRVGGFTTVDVIQAGTNGPLIELTFEVIRDENTSLIIIDPVDDVETWTLGMGQVTNGVPLDDGLPFSLLASAILPSSRSVQVGTAATAFATIINTGARSAVGCSIARQTSVAADFLFQTTDPATNAITGTAATPVDIAPGQRQSFVIALTPTAAFAPTDVAFIFDCTNTNNPAGVTTGLNTLFLSASDAPIPDIVALAATLQNDGIVRVGEAGGVFSVATVNLGASDMIIASADTGSANLPINIRICETEPATGICLDGIFPPSTTRVSTQINTSETPTFGIFVEGTGAVPFDPATNRIFVRFQDAGGVTRGSTSVAVCNQDNPDAPSLTCF